MFLYVAMTILAGIIFLSLMKKRKLDNCSVSFVLSLLSGFFWQFLDLHSLSDSLKGICSYMTKSHGQFP